MIILYCGIKLIPVRHYIQHCEISTNIVSKYCGWYFLKPQRRCKVSRRRYCTVLSSRKFTSTLGEKSENTHKSLSYFETNIVKLYFDFLQEWPCPAQPWNTPGYPAWPDIFMLHNEIDSGSALYTQHCEMPTNIVSKCCDWYFSKPHKVYHGIFSSWKFSTVTSKKVS